MSEEGGAGAGSEPPTADDAHLQCSLVACLRGALLFEDLLQVVVNEGLGALGDGGRHQLQARGHGEERAPPGRRLEARRAELPEGVWRRRHRGRDSSGSLVEGAGDDGAL